MDIMLRKWTLDDAQALAALFDALERTYLSNRIPSPYTAADAAAWLETITAREGKSSVARSIWVDGSLVGNISVKQKEDVYGKDAEIGYFLQRESYGKGIMTEAVRQVCALAFSTLDLLRITALVYSPNTASRRVLEKNGFLLEGVMKNAVVKGDMVYDLCIYGKLR
ncbi:MAG TPA: GNAT family N-acetyltransferase [Candidatus Aphodomonas merdavium]|nr:GNAT family N-acetyltransferase [Candidatus Aphodomonas merdavium]